VAKLPKSFYLRDDVVKISKELLGKVLCSFTEGKFTSGIITETEAYEGEIDKASHAYNNRRTDRTEIMFAEGGKAYVYLCYGIHHLFNIVTHKKDVPHAVLVRAIKPIDGIETILERRKKDKLTAKTTIGPGTVSEALGIKTKHTGTDLTGNLIWLEDRKIKINSKDIIIGPRVGIDYAGDHAHWPYRFRINL
jgi:DNA-3-methyladenine glycosylase